MPLVRLGTIMLMECTWFTSKCFQPTVGYFIWKS